MTTMTVLRVVAKREGFRRAGFVFGSQARDVPLTALTDVQRAAITRDPMLLVTPVEVEIADQSEVLPEGTGETGGGDAAAVVPSVAVAAATPAPGRKRK